MAYSPSGYAYNMPSPDTSGQGGGGGMDWLSMAIYAGFATLGGMLFKGNENIPKDYNEWLKMQEKEFDIWKSKIDYNLSEGYRNWARMQEHELEQWQWKRQTQMADLFKSPLKPQTPYYGIERNLPAYDYMLGKNILGNMGEKLGTERMEEYGIDLGQMRTGMGLNQPYSQYYKSWQEGQPKFDYQQPGAFIPSEKTEGVDITDTWKPPFIPVDGNGGGDGDGKNGEEDRDGRRKRGGGTGTITETTDGDSLYAQWAKKTLDKILEKYKLGV